MVFIPNKLFFGSSPEGYEIIAVITFKLAKIAGQLSQGLLPEC